MAHFDPNKKYGDGGASSIPSGQYLLAMIAFERKSSKDGNPYLRAKYRVIAGPAKGRTFYSVLGIDINHPTSGSGTAARLSIYCKCIGVTEAFDLDDDRAFSSAFLGKAFKALVETKQNGQYTNTNVGRYVPEMSPRELEMAEEFWREWSAENEFAGDDDEFNPDDYAEDDFASSKGRSKDDIPF